MADTRKKYTPAEMLSKRAEAKRLLLEQRMSQKDIALKLDVSEKSVSKWVTHNKWKLAEQQALVMPDGGLSLQRLAGIVDVQAFGQYLRQRDPPLYRKALGHLAAYILTLSNQ